MACLSAAAGARCATAAWRLGSIGLSRCETAVRGACLIASQPSILPSILYHGTVGQLTATCHGKQESVEQLEQTSRKSETWVGWGLAHRQGSWVRRGARCSCRRRKNDCHGDIDVRKPLEPNADGRVGQLAVLGVRDRASAPSHGAARAEVNQTPMSRIRINAGNNGCLPACQAVNCVSSDMCSLSGCVPSSRLPSAPTWVLTTDRGAAVEAATRTVGCKGIFITRYIHSQTRAVVAQAPFVDVQSGHHSTSPPPLFLLSRVSTGVFPPYSQCASRISRAVLSINSLACHRSLSMCMNGCGTPGKRRTVTSTPAATSSWA